MTSQLPAMKVAERAGRLRSTMDEQGFDALFINKLVNIRWLTGFTGSNGHLVVTPDRLVLITDGRYRDQAATQMTACGVEAELEITRSDVELIVGSVVQPGDTVGIGLDDMTVAAHRRLADQLESVHLVDSQRQVEQLRGIKDEGELARLQTAAVMADEAFEQVVPLLHDRPTERQVAAELDYRMRLSGADEMSFDTIVGSGPNSALPHATPGDRVIEAGDLVVLDFGARVDGYGSDMTRTVVAGGKPTAEQIRLYEAVAEAQRDGVAVVADGVECAAVDAACRQTLERHELGQYFTHGTGHAIGLEIHEQPMLSATAADSLRAGQVVTVEPGAYLGGFGGVRVEDSVIVTDQGCQPITHSPKGLVPWR